MFGRETMKSGYTARGIMAAALVSAFFGGMASCHAQAYPTKAIHLIVGFAAGGGNDILARIVGVKMAEGLGQPVVIENKPGAGAIIATDYVAHSAPDGYTLLIGASGQMVINPAVYTKLPYATLQDFTPISMIASFPLFVVVNPSFPAKTVGDLVTYIKANPTKANYSGASAAFQLATERFKFQTGITQMEFIAYKGTNEAARAVMSNEVLMTIGDSPALAGLLKSGQVRALAVTTTERSREFPDVPTLAQAGVKNAEVRLFSGLFAPSATPAAIVKKLEAEMIRVIKLPDIQEKLIALSADPSGNTSAEFKHIVATELTQWAQVAKAANVKIEQ
jgi:tripartite-type tricarboxylate transporter receptor subunit TctC